MSKKVIPLSGQLPKTFIRAWREKKGYTLADVARMIEATPPTLSRVETGQGMLTWAVVNALAEALEQSPYDLLFRDPNSDGIEEFISELRQMPPAVQDLVAHVGRSVMSHESIAPSKRLSPSREKLSPPEPLLINQSQNE